MKKLFALLLALVMVLSLFAGCNDDATVADPTDGTQGDVTPTDDTTKPADTTELAGNPCPHDLGL